MRSGRLIMIVGVVFFLIALIVGVVWVVSNMGGGGDQGGDVPPPTPVPTMKEIVVGAQAVVPRGTEITEVNNAVKLATWPEEAVPPRALTDLEDAYGRIARVDILANVPVTEDMLTEEAGEAAAGGSDAALHIPAGKVAYALPIARWSSVAWALQPGDHVDVLISLLLVDLDQDFQTVLPSHTVLCMYYQSPEGGMPQFGCVDIPAGRGEVYEDGLIIEGPRGEQRPRMVSQLTVQDAVVLRVGDWPKSGEEQQVVQEQPQPQPQQVEGEATPAPPPPPDVQSLTLIVTHQDAVVLKFAEESAASIDLVLRSANDAGKPFSTEAVTLQYLFGQFGIEVPPKLPYGLTPATVKVRSGTLGPIVEDDLAGARVPLDYEGVGLDE